MTRGNRRSACFDAMTAARDYGAYQIVLYVTYSGRGATPVALRVGNRRDQNPPRITGAYPLRSYRVRSAVRTTSLRSYSEGEPDAEQGEPTR